MQFGARLAVVAGLSLLPAIWYAQSYSQPAYPRTAGQDVAYCQALSNVYVRYIGHDWQYGNYARWCANNDAQVALTQCQTKTASAIPVLERELLANKLTLPVRG